ncbi:hypothetical protein [Paraburkholderia sp. J8-2]|uniref:hypothetical protein n=1 Tax=Paraburkholderia sp. J8-2 TaxID=2805440 RepID=UPI002AB77B39|nr:hypothetical protein [Paraburkholderia sp. J8-2]
MKKTKKAEKAPAKQDTASAEEVSALRSEIEALCWNVPRYVVDGDFETARNWKALAFGAFKVATSTSATLPILRNARDSMRRAANEETARGAA